MAFYIQSGDSTIKVYYKGGLIMHLSSVSAKNRPSPVNEQDWIAAYKRRIPTASYEDNYDIAAVVTESGIPGHAMMHYSDNRSKDGRYHPCRNFVSDDELKYYM